MLIKIRMTEDAIKCTLEKKRKRFVMAKNEMVQA
jgi:hypothetical protein